MTEYKILLSTFPKPERCVSGGVELPTPEQTVLKRCLVIEEQYPHFATAPHHILVEYASLLKFLLGRK